ncbi:MAG: GAF domain-containing SpoIIE family protein phosphatase [bacterium]
MKATFVQEIDRALTSLREFREALDKASREGSEGALLHDIAGRLPDMERLLAQILQGLEFQTEFDLLRDTALLLARAVDEDQVLSAILEGLKNTIPYDAAGIFLIRDDPERGGSTILAQKILGYPKELLAYDKFRQKVDEGILGWVIRNAKAELVDNVLDDPRYIMARSETRSEIASPIISMGVVIGCINLEADRVGAFRADSLRLLENLASYAAVALDRAQIHRELVQAREVERELDIARQIQLNLLPKGAPTFEGYDIAGLNVPSLAIGGDYYDFIQIENRDLGLVVADVAGKGVAAGLVMSGLRAALRARVETIYSIKYMLSDINRFLYESTGADRFVTAAYGVLNGPNGRFTYVNAGHNPSLLVHPDGREEWLKTGGPLLGVLPDARFEHGFVDLLPGAILVMYTDGIVEAGGDVGEEYGGERVARLVQSLRGESARVIARAIEREAVAYNGGRGELDDRTVIVVKRS